MLIGIAAAFVKTVLQITLKKTALFDCTNNCKFPINPLEDD